MIPLTHVFLAVLTLAPFTVLADKSPDPSKLVYQGCKPTEAWIAKHKPTCKTNVGIQMAECFSNTRVTPNAFAYFVTDHEKDKSEGAPYGHCTAFTVTPTEEDLEADPESTCGFWDRGQAIPEHIVGIKIETLPVICPYNLDDCYSVDWYKPGCTLAINGSAIPTVKGRIHGPKDNAGNPLFCECLDCGCAVPPYEKWATHDLGCDVKNQCRPYTGDLAAELGDKGKDEDDKGSQDAGSGYGDAGKSDGDDGKGNEQGEQGKDADESKKDSEATKGADQDKDKGQGEKGSEEANKDIDQGSKGGESEGSEPEKKESESGKKDDAHDDEQSGWHWPWLKKHKEHGSSKDYDHAGKKNEDQGVEDQGVVHKPAKRVIARKF